MIRRVGLIAEREFRAYAMTASFWVALAMGPLLMAAALLLSGGHGSAAAPPTATLTLTQDPAGTVTAQFGQGFPLSAQGRAQFVDILQRDGRLHGAVRVVEEKPKSSLDPEALRRFALLMMLWMTLAGSLGMLLQAVVRERSNRALESLLAAARPADVVFGKLLGVGAVSLLVVSAWLGGSAAMGALAPASGGAVAVLLQGLAHPAVLLRAGAIYVLAFGFYGLTTVAIGALARDNADAQNLARPMFATLLVVFFTALASTAGAHSLTWLVYIPPFTPFMLLIQPQAAGVEFVALDLLAAATVLAGWLAVRALHRACAGSTRISRPARLKF